MYTQRYDGHSSRYYRLQSLIYPNIGNNELAYLSDRWTSEEMPTHLHNMQADTATSNLQRTVTVSTTAANLFIVNRKRLLLLFIVIKNFATILLLLKPV